MHNVSQHLREMLCNRAGWERKPLLRDCYAEYYQEIKSYLLPETFGPTLELGSGLGLVKEYIPHCQTSDIFPNEWLDRVENAYEVNSLDKSFGNLLLFDVFHHLQYPGSAMDEFLRLLPRGGRLLIFDPDMGLLARLIYGIFHHEPLGLRQSITWLAPDAVDKRALPYYAAQGNAHRVFVEENPGHWRSDWELVSLRRFSGLRYLSSGGFSGPNLCPRLLEPALSSLDALGNRLPSIFSARLLIVLQKK
jgi:SAM-dependent methyltransferase